MRVTRKRIALDVLLLLAAFIAPPWFAFGIATIGLFAFESFYEIFAVGFIIDVLYGIRTPYLVIPLLYVIFSGILFMITVFLKKHLRFYI